MRLAREDVQDVLHVLEIAGHLVQINVVIHVTLSAQDVRGAALDVRDAQVLVVVIVKDVVVRVIAAVLPPVLAVVLLGVLAVAVNAVEVVKVDVEQDVPEIVMGAADVIVHVQIVLGVLDVVVAEVDA